MPLTKFKNATIEVKGGELVESFTHGFGRVECILSDVHPQSVYVKRAGDIDSQLMTADNLTLHYE